MKNKSILIYILFFGFAGKLFAQAQLQPWGNMAGIRVKGQLMEFETNVSVANADWSVIKSTGKEKQRPKYSRVNGAQVVSTAIDSLHFVETVTDSTDHSAVLHLLVRATDSVSKGIYLALSVPEKIFATGKLLVPGRQLVPLSAGVDKITDYLKSNVAALTFQSSLQQYKFKLGQRSAIMVRTEPHGKRLMFYIPVRAGGLGRGETAEADLTMTVSGTVDQTPVTLQLDPSKEGREFVGFGGNFRLQNPKNDPPVIDYCLDNMRVAFGRVEMPWRFWQPNKSDRPIDSAKSGRLHPFVEKSMLMAQRLSKKNMPIILSAWSAPKWAIVGQPKFRPDSNGVWGNPLDTAVMPEIYKSIGDYIMYLRDQYGVNITYFSFNESDLGINVRQTGAEHAALIKGLGQYFQQVGLSTRPLLGDNSDATTYDFIYPAMKDAEAKPFIGAVSFHSWRGWETETLQHWADAADKLRLPLIVAEGSIDAQAWGYPAIFEEPSYAREEINLYTRLLSICQPTAILQWQLTSDYSPLAGGGIFGDTSRPLHPTQRFWNLKQLASTPANLKAIGARSNKELVSVAALGDRSKGVYCVHLVNNGATRKAIVSGLPVKVNSLRMYVTDSKRNMQEGKQLPVKQGIASFVLDAGSFTTLVSN